MHPELIRFHCTLLAPSPEHIAVRSEPKRRRGERRSQRLSRVGTCPVPFVIPAQREAAGVRRVTVDTASHDVTAVVGPRQAPGDRVDEARRAETACVTRAHEKAVRVYPHGFNHWTSVGVDHQIDGLIDRATTSARRRSPASRRPACSSRSCWCEARRRGRSASRQGRCSTSRRRES
jgi:hypothetical protein